MTVLASENQQVPPGAFVPLLFLFVRLNIGAWETQDPSPRAQRYTATDPHAQRKGTKVPMHRKEKIASQTTLNESAPNTKRGVLVGREPRRILGSNQT